MNEKLRPYLLDGPKSAEDPVLTPWESIEPTNVAPNAANSKQLVAAPGAGPELPQSLAVPQAETLADPVRESEVGSMT